MQIRRALYAWAFNKAQRDAGPPTDELARAIELLRKEHGEAHGVDGRGPRPEGAGPVGVKNDIRAAAPNSVAQKRVVFYGALRYTVEL
ncbi:hypothetical protein GCM10018962_13890 [Dactylosporangium matsuzakiense]|uniref:Uncharacterized protein n=1 Tax=Dactylosporangium matsuzakiense TaxID=53360 RepID=A0A9W6NQX2_9ACTN|nr:hypothetical protein GCM10017581_077320 [Dactylosporangium matsuzakiense]